MAVRERSWDWLLELRQRLKVDLVVVDAWPSMLLPPGGSHASKVTGLLEKRDERLLAAVASVTSHAPCSLEIEGVQVVCVSVTVERKGAGTLIVGRDTPPRQDPRAALAQLELVASWISTAVRAHLLSPPAFSSTGLDRIAALTQLLTDAADRESDRGLIRLFSEAMAVWHDIEVSGYVETGENTFIEDVILPGAGDRDHPHAIPAAEVPQSTDLIPIAQGHLDHFRLPVNRDGFLWRFQSPEGAWLLVFTGVLEAHDHDRLKAYVGVLRIALVLATTSATAHLVASMRQRLEVLDDVLEARAAAALEELRSGLGAAVAVLDVASAHRKSVLRVGSPALPQGGLRVTEFRATLVKRSERHYTTTVLLGRYANTPFTPRDHAVVKAAVATFDQWVSGALTAARRYERRAVSRGYVEVLERSASEAVERGVSIAVVVLLMRDAVSRKAAQRWIAGLRAQMRASDLAGMLSDSEIGLLMHDTAAPQAKAIATRLRAVVGDMPDREAILIGVASRTPGDGAADGILHDARADAAANLEGLRASLTRSGVSV